ncbi:MAG: MerC domain-containing protein [Pseudomonadota bacterium]
MTSRASNAVALDVSAVSLSGFCLVHCLALPLAAAFLPAAGALAEAEWLHRAFVIAALPISLAAMARSRNMRGAAGFMLAAGVGLALLIAGAFVEALHDFETPLTVAGALLLASAHLWRWREHVASLGRGPD